MFIDTCATIRDYDSAVPSISGQWVKALRVRAGFTTKAALAKAATMDPSKLSRIENDQPVNLTLDSLERLAATLRVPVGVLFDEPRLEDGTDHARPTAGYSGLEGLIQSLDAEFPAEDSIEGDIHKAIAALTRALRRPRPRAATG